MKNTLHDIAEQFYNSPFWVGMVGAICSVLLPSESEEKKITFFQKMARVFVGGVIAGFATPLFAYFVGYDHPQLLNGLTFVVGLLGMSIAMGLYKIGQEFVKDPKGFIQKIRDARRKRNS